MSVADQRKRAHELLGLVGLSEKADSFPNQLSGGQQQRVAIARALMSRPSILLCDEATSALDTLTTGQVLDLLAKINREMGVTIVLITHSLFVARKICGRVAVMESGRIVEKGSVESVFEHPKAAVTKALLGIESGKEVA
jgi:D-methionine transport system ATP-binding protein